MAKQPLTGVHLPYGQNQDDGDSIITETDDFSTRGGHDDRYATRGPPPSRIPLQKCLKILGTNETLSSFEAWRGSLTYVLSYEPAFAPFLISGKSWLKKQKNNPLRGLYSAQEVVQLEQDYESPLLCIGSYSELPPS